MANQIRLLPTVLNLSIYSGDGVKIKFTCKDNDNEPVDVTGDVVAQIRVDRLTPDDPPIVEFTVSMVDSYLGIIHLSLTGVQTQQLTDLADKDGTFTGVWDVEWHPADDEPRTLCQGVVECVPDVTR